MTSQITLGTNVRSWVTLEVKDITAEEIAVLENIESDEAVALGRKLAEAGRLKEIEVEYETGHDPWARDNDPVVIDYADDTEEEPSDG